MTNMSDAAQTAVATGFVLYTMETGKSMSNNKATVWQNASNGIDAVAEISDGNYHNDDEQIVITGFRMDGDDTLMSAEERLQIISTKKNYKVSA